MFKSLCLHKVKLFIKYTESTRPTIRPTIFDVFFIHFHKVEFLYYVFFTSLYFIVPHKVIVDSSATQSGSPFPFHLLEYRTFRQCQVQCFPVKTVQGLQLKLEHFFLPRNILKILFSLHPSK